MLSFFTGVSARRLPRSRRSCVKAELGSGELLCAQRCACGGQLLTVALGQPGSYSKPTVSPSRCPREAHGLMEAAQPLLASRTDLERPALRV